MGRKAFRFDNGSRLDPGLSLSFSRGIATKDGLGASVAVDTPRYDRTSILCGAPVITAVSNAGTGSWNVMATGVDADGSTPVLCLQDITNLKLHVFKSAIAIDGSGNSTYKYDISAGTSTYPDALKESADKLDGGAGALGDYNFKPQGGVCCHGIILLNCSVAYRDAGPAWRRNRVGVMHCNLENLTGAKSTWWRKTWIAIESPECDTRDMSNLAIGWSLQAWSSPNKDGSAPTSFAIVPVDYESDPSVKHGGHAYVCVITRPSTSSGTWTPGVFQQALTFSRAAAGAHAHCGLVLHAADGSAKVLVSRGDSHANNGIYTGSIAAISSYSAGASDQAAGSYNSYSGGTGIGSMTLVNGRIGGLTGSPPAVDTTHDSACRMGLQPLGVQMGNSADSIIVGIDEQHCAILMASSVPTSGGMTLTPLFRSARFAPVAGKASGSTNTINTSRLCLQLINRAPNNPIAECIANVTPQANQYQQSVLCHGVYSPNGVEFGVCWNTLEPEQARPGFFGTSLIIGSPTGRGNGVRTIPVPSYLRGRPLMVDTGGKNYLASGALTLTQSSGMSTDTASELNATEALPASYTPAPGFGTPIYFASRAADRVSASVTTATASTGNPSTITTNAPHGLVSGVTVTLAGFTNTGTSLNNTWTITVTGSTTFTVPCNVTGGADLVGTVTYSPSAAKFFVQLCNAGSALPAVTAGTTSHLLVQFAIHPAKVADWRSSGNGGVGSCDIAPPNSSTDIGSNSCSQGFRFRLRLAGSDFTGYTENIYIPFNDGSPHIVTIPVAVSAYAARSANYTVDLYVESTSIATPIKGWLTPIGVYTTEQAPCPIAAGTTAPNTAFSLTGFSLPTTGFTAYWSGKVPTTPMIEMACAQSHTNTTATRTSTTVTRLAGVSAGLDSVTNAFAGHRLFGIVNSTSTPFGDYGLAISSSAYVSTGVHDITHASHSQGSGSWTQIDITMPSSTASAQPLFALANTDRSRIIAVYMDCLDGLIKVRYWNGSAWGSYATISGFFFVPECPIHVSLAYDGAGTLTMRASAGGSAISSTTLSVTPDQALTQLIAGDGTSVAPMEWWGGMVVDSAESASQQPARLAGLSYIPSPARTSARRNRGRTLATR